MLLRVYVDTPDQFAAWIANQHQPGNQEPQAAVGRHVFETLSCMNCHTVEGTAATGRFGPDLTHLMSSSTIGSGSAVTHPDNLRELIKDPDTSIKGSINLSIQHRI